MQKKDLDRRPLVFITGSLPKVALRLLEPVANIRVHQQKQPITPTGLKRGIKGAEALICFLYDSIPGSILSSAPKLKIVANAAAGFNNIDTAAAQAAGVWVTNTPDVLTEATAELTLALLLGVARKIVPADRFLRQGKFRGWDFYLFLGNQLAGKTLGIVGMGRIGQAVAQRASAFGLKILYHNDLRLPAEREQELGASYTPFAKLLKQSDFISLHVPLTSKTRHMIAAPQLASMKPTAILINTSRGPVIDEKSLVEALKKGRIAGAGLDVYEQEPQIEKGLMSLENIILLPHIGSATVEARNGIAITAVQNVLAVLHGKQPPNPVIIPER